MADIIKLLPDHVANQIAAGEVVQRPASVVKELLENAIDAGSNTIKLIIKEGGKLLILVVDNGSGMSETDARLSFERHATSKIQKAEDLFELNTKGFRGEALASITAIAHVEMHTKTDGVELGAHLKIEGSKIISQEMVVTQKGTSIAVKNLFFNIPARRNFLKSNQVELRHILDEFHRVALAHPSIAFQFYNNGTELFNLPIENLRQRIVHIFGSKTNEKLVPVDEDTQVVKISGFICKPQFAKKSRGEQFFFVNNRFVKSPYLNHAVVAAFEGLIKQGAHPGYFLNLSVDPNDIDINIHPTKTEIKFNDEHTLYAILKATIKHSLGQFSVVPSLDFEHDGNLETPYAYKDKNAVQPQVVVDSKFNPFKEEGSFSGKSNSYQKQPEKSWESMYVGLESKMDDSNLGGLTFESEAVTGTIFDKEKNESETVITTFQLRRKYIVTTIKSGMVIIDQNRAHQRVLYEDFLKHITLKESMSQQLLFPLSLSFSKADIVLLTEMKENLASIGFIFETLTPEKVELKGLPLMISENEANSVLEQIMSDHKENVKGDGFSQTDILAKSLCKSLAVKTGDVMESESQTILVDNLFACKDSRVSPFNKSIYVTLNENDIDKKFN